jgi:predicted O-methyltransferase YrrM
MDEITRDYIEKYLYEMLPPRDALLVRLESEAEQRNIPIVGPYAGSFLAMLVCAVRAKRILEVGAAIGYSTIWLARACAPWRGRVTTLEVRAETAAEARHHISEAGLARRVEVLVGDGMDLVPQLKGRFDFVFLDAEKHQYRALTELLLPKLRRGGLLAVDNVLWAGLVAKNENDPTTQAIRAFNEYLKHHPELETVIVPLRDGIAISRKISP